MTYTPFIQKIATGYGAVEVGILAAIVDFNVAAQNARKATARHYGSCAICHDLLVSPESGAPQLVLSLLPKCEHVFHEACIMQWLSPVQMVTKLEQRGSASMASQQSMLQEPFDRTPHLLQIFDSTQQVAHQRGATRQERERIFHERREQFRRQLITAQDLLYSSHPHMDHRNHSPQELGSNDRATATDHLDTYEDLTVTQRPSPARNYRCPLCREHAFPSRLPICSDTVQLLRVRYRLTDLAYSIFGYERTTHEELERTAIIEFLSRRYTDTLIESPRETTPCSADCRAIFWLARQTLRKNLGDYQKKYKLTAAEQLRVVQFDLVFENYQLMDRAIPYFFDPHPNLRGIFNFKISLSGDALRIMNEDPKKFFQTWDFLLGISLLATAEFKSSESRAKGLKTTLAIQIDEEAERTQLI
ncbi:MAG: hypothetical protein Q9210_003520 [Variospora velana]